MKSPTMPVTGAEEFRAVLCGPEGQKLFSVKAGLPVFDALEEAACILDTALGVIRECPAAEGLGPSSTHAVSNLLEQVGACLGAILGSPNIDDLEAALTDMETQQ